MRIWLFFLTLCFLPQFAMAKPDLRLCTGAEGGSYWGFAQDLKKMVKGSLNVKIIPTNGSWDNLTRLEASPQQCDAIIVQSDIYFKYVTNRPDAFRHIKDHQNPDQLDLVEVMPEYVHLFCNRESITITQGTGKAKRSTEVEDFYGLSPVRHRISVGKYNSGTFHSWETFGKYSPKFAAFLPMNADFETIRANRFAADHQKEDDYQARNLSMIEGIHAIMADQGKKRITPIHCVAAISGLGSESILQMQQVYGHRLKLLEINDSRIFNAKPAANLTIYQRGIIPQSTYPEFLDHDITTIVLSAILLTHRDWKRENSDEYKDMRRAVRAWHNKKYPAHGGDAARASASGRMQDDAAESAPRDVQSYYAPSANSQSKPSQQMQIPRISAPVDSNADQK